MTAEPWPADDPHGMAARFGITRRHCLSWHEGGHAIVGQALGVHVFSVTIEPPTPGCRWEARDPGWPGASDPALSEACRHGGAIAAGGAVAAAMRRAGLNLPMRSSSERLSSTDMTTYRYYEALSPEPADQFQRSCLTLAADTLEAHRPAFLALVDALLERGTLQRAEILALWESAA